MAQQHAGCNGCVRPGGIAHVERQIYADILIQVEPALIVERHQADGRHPFRDGSDAEARVVIHPAEGPGEESFAVPGQHQGAAGRTALYSHRIQESGCFVGQGAGVLFRGRPGSIQSGQRIRARDAVPRQVL